MVCSSRFALHAKPGFCWSAGPAGTAATQGKHQETTKTSLIATNPTNQDIHPAICPQTQPQQTSASARHTPSEGEYFKNGQAGAPQTLGVAGAATARRTTITDHSRALHHKANRQPTPRDGAWHAHAIGSKPCRRRKVNADLRKNAQCICACVGKN